MRPFSVATSHGICSLWANFPSDKANRNTLRRSGWPSLWNNSWQPEASWLKVVWPQIKQTKQPQTFTFFQLRVKELKQQTQTNEFDKNQNGKNHYLNEYIIGPVIITWINIKWWHFLYFFFTYPIPTLKKWQFIPFKHMKETVVCVLTHPNLPQSIHHQFLFRCPAIQQGFCKQFTLLPYHETSGIKSS